MSSFSFGFFWAESFLLEFVYSLFIRGAAGGGTKLPFLMFRCLFSSEPLFWAESLFCDSLVLWTMKLFFMATIED